MICQPWQVCPPGTGVRVAGTAYSDVVCSECPNGRFSSGIVESMTTRFQENTDNVGSNTTEEISLTSIAIASSLSAKRRAKIDQTEFTPTCKAWRNCPPGSGVLAEGTRRKDLTCMKCPRGTFSRFSNDQECKPWTECGPGFEEVSAGTRFGDVQCRPCPQGRFKDSDGPEMCKKHSRCPDGSGEAMAGTSTSDTSCVLCADGKFKYAPVQDTVTGMLRYTEYSGCPPVPKPCPE